VSGTVRQAPAAFDPSTYGTFRFLGCSLDEQGEAILRYALEEDVVFSERIRIPVEGPLSEAQLEGARGLLALLHWVAGVSYYKTALPGRVVCEGEQPGPAAAALLDALYSEGLGELAYRNGLPLPRPRFPVTAAASLQSAPPPDGSRRLLVPVGGGKDSAVAIEVARASGLELVLFSIGDAPPIVATAQIADLPHLIARRTIDPLLFECNAVGAFNGHVPITAIVTCVALLAAHLNGYDTVTMANERSASAGNLVWDGVEVNHQFSKGLAAERLLSAAVAEADAGVRQLSLLRPASELAIARAFARMPVYHPAFTSCNAIFRIDPALRASSWCGDCPKCRFVFLALAPFTTPEHLREIFGADLLEDESQFEGFALLAASGGHKPFECVGEEQESLAAMRLLAADERWREHAVVRRLVTEVLAGQPLPEGDPTEVLALSEDHDVPAELMDGVRALLGS
jgi:hypothetical protein